ncbi:MAG: putative redox protein [Petrotoga sp.]|nr:putative redox protein [Petrotoga sp.]
MGGKRGETLVPFSLGVGSGAKGRYKTKMEVLTLTEFLLQNTHGSHFYMKTPSGDVVTILNKMKVKYDALNLRILTERSEEHPKKYTKIHIIYEFKGKDLPMDRLQRAAQLSQEKYCGATATFRGSTEITYEVKIVE